MIIIPDYILENADLSAEDKISMGMQITLDLETKGEVKVLDEKAKDIIKKKEDWKDASIGILVGPSGRKQYRLKGELLKIFLELFRTYGIPDGKRNAAWAFYQTIVTEIKSLSTVEAKNSFVASILKAARQAAFKNEERRSMGGTPAFLQGWITARRWEDFE